MGKYIEITNDNDNEVKEGVVLLYFHNDIDKNCIEATKVVKYIASMTNERVKICSIDVEIPHKINKDQMHRSSYIPGVWKLRRLISTGSLG